MALEETVTRPLKITGEWLKASPEVAAIVATRISWRLTTPYPAIRLTDLGPMNRTAAGNLRRVQVECWADDFNTAEELAAAVERACPLAVGDWTDGYCAGASVEAGPFANPDPGSEKFRHQLDVVLALFGEVPAP